MLTSWLYLHFKVAFILNDSCICQGSAWSADPLPRFHNNDLISWNIERSLWYRWTPTNMYEIIEAMNKFSVKNTQTNSGCNLLTDPFGRYLAGLGRPLLAVGFWVDDTVSSNIKYLVRKPPLSFFWNKIVFHFNLPHTTSFTYRVTHTRNWAPIASFWIDTPNSCPVFTRSCTKMAALSPTVAGKDILLNFLVNFILRYPFVSYRALTLNTLSIMSYYSSRIGRDINDSRPPFVQKTRRIWKVCDRIACDSVPIP